MVHQIAYFKDALSAWEQWNLTSFDYKYDHLKALRAALEAQNNSVAKVVSYHLQHASSLLAETHQLIGPTGETNELYAAGRGVALIICESNLVNQANTLSSAFAMITCALVAGNSVVVCSDNAELNRMIKQALSSVNLPSNLVQVVAYDASASLLDSDVRSVGYIGHSNIEHALNLQLAKRNGAIVGLVSETDLESSTLAHDPHLSLRFITERTRTINITAVGGNATLLEMGSDAH